MRFLLDESADFPLGAYLIAQGHNVTYIARDYPHGLSDRAILEITVVEERILITNDRDFGELVFHRKLPHAGIVLFRLGEESILTKIYWLEVVLRQYSDQLQHFLVVNDRGIRVRASATDWSDISPPAGESS